MKNKSETTTHVSSFFSIVQTQFNVKIKKVQIDNGIDFNLHSFFNSHGVIHHKSCVETLQQNGIVECKHQHILNVAQALIFQSHLPLHFWGDCILTAIHLINQTRTSLLCIKSPYEILFYIFHLPIII